MLVLDPALLIWDRSDYDSRQHEYWQLASDFVALLDILDESPIRLVLSAALAEHIIDGFPADQLCAGADLHDFTRAVYAFLARAIESHNSFSAAKDFSVSPNVLARAGVPEPAQTEHRACLAFAFREVAESHYVSHLVVWPFADRLITSVAYPGKRSVVALSHADFSALRNLSVRRTYEEHDKHNSTYGYGSRLPVGVSADVIQQALNVAIEVSGSDCLCARIGSSGAVLLFRRHHQDMYHAYPIEPSEYSKYGINPALIPESGNPA